MSTMKEKPILFSGEMVRAILDGRKTQTRRVYKPKNPNPYEIIDQDDDGILWPFWQDESGYYHPVLCPYGQTSQKLWVRETWAVYGQFKNGPDYCYRADEDKSGVYWKPSIHMPRQASRITLEITNIRVERLQGISAEDAKAEGIENLSTSRHKDFGIRGMVNAQHPVRAFWLLWNSINAKRGFGWEVNPWVWVIEFRRVTP